MSATPKYDVECAQCSAAFQTVRTTAKYCSGACRAAASRERKVDVPETDVYVLGEIKIEHASIANAISHGLIPEYVSDSTDELTRCVGTFVSFVLQPPLIDHVVKGYSLLMDELAGDAIEFDADGFEVEQLPGKDMRETAAQMRFASMTFPLRNDEES